MRAQLQLHGQEGLCRQTEGASLANKDFMAATVRATEVKQGQSNPGLVFSVPMFCAHWWDHEPRCWVAPAFPHLAEQSFPVQGEQGWEEFVSRSLPRAMLPAHAWSPIVLSRRTVNTFSGGKLTAKATQRLPDKAMAPAFAIPLVIQHGDCSLAECCILKRELASCTPAGSQSLPS